MTFAEACTRFLAVYGEEDAPVRPAGVKLVPTGHPLPEGAVPSDEHQGIPWCEAVRLAATEGQVVVMHEGNIGCPAAAIALGLVDAHRTEPLAGTRKYTDLMAKTASPADFTEGRVYACKDSGDMQFALFGDDDTGRYQTLGAALHALSGMSAIQPAEMDAAVAYPPGGLDLAPDVVILALRPREALLVIQGGNFFTGNRLEMSTVGIRGLCADLTAVPFLEQRMNGSFFCLGARALGGWGGDLLGLGMPFTLFDTAVRGMEKSAGGFPYEAYPR